MFGSLLGKIALIALPLGLFVASQAVYIVDERDPLPEQPMPGDGRKSIAGTKRTAGFGRRRHREIELAAEEAREEEGQQRSTGQRPADRFDLVTAKRLGELRHERIERRLIDEGRLEIEPQAAVQA